MLIVFFLTNIVPSYAMDRGDDPSSKRYQSVQLSSPLSHERIGGYSPDSSPEEVKIDGLRKQSSFSELMAMGGLSKPQHIYRGVSGEDEDESKISENAGGAFRLSLFHPQLEGEKNEATETDSPIHKTPIGIGRTESEEERINAINVKAIEDLAIGSPVSMKSQAGTDIIEPELVVSELYTCGRFCFYPKKLASVVFSTVASLSFGLLAYELGKEINQGSGMAMFGVGLTANALLYYTIYDGVSAADFPVGWNQSRSKNAALLCFGVLNLIASVPLGYYIGYSSISSMVPYAFAQFTGAVSLISLLLLYTKSATRFSNDISNKVNMVKLKGNERTNAYSRQAYLEEVAALGRGEISNFSNIIDANEDDEFSAIMLKLKPKGPNDWYWAKEIVGGAFGVLLAGGFAGIYLYEIGFHVYSLFLKNMFPHLPEDTIRYLSYAGACAIAIGPNTLQIERTYSVFKTYTTQVLRAYDTYVKKNPLLLTRVHDEEGGEAQVPFERKTNWQERGADALVLVLAGGVALTRTALCRKFIEDRTLRNPVTFGTTLAYFCIYYYAINALFDAWSETGRKRKDIIKYINDGFDERNKQALIINQL